MPKQITLLEIILMVLVLACAMGWFFETKNREAAVSRAEERLHKKICDDYTWYCKEVIKYEHEKAALKDLREQALLEEWGRRVDNCWHWPQKP